MKFSTKYQLPLMYSALGIITGFNYYVVYTTNSITSAIMAGLCTGYILYALGARPLINTYKDQIKMQDNYLKTVTQTFIQCSARVEKDLATSKQLVRELQDKLDAFDKLHPKFIEHIKDVIGD